jgi:hypothetical protein
MCNKLLLEKETMARKIKEQDEKLNQLNNLQSNDCVSKKKEIYNGKIQSRN